QTSRREDAGAPRNTNVTRNATARSKLALIAKLNNTGPIEFISNLLSLSPAQSAPPIGPVSIARASRPTDRAMPQRSAPPIHRKTSPAYDSAPTSSPFRAA